ncbi:transporter substrate-binding domain-containing protein [bacterium]|nr:transporter substrate-binding domain-containing protein [bacterium]
MNRNCCLIYCTVLSFFLAFPTSSLAKPLKVQIKLLEPWGYYSSINQNSKEFTGIWIDIIKLYAKKTGIEFQISLAPQARVIQNLESGKTDMSFLAKSEEENPNLVYVAHMFSIATIIVSLNEKKIETYDDLYRTRIGIVRGSKNDPMFDADGALFKQAYRDQKIIVNMLFQKRLDAIVGDSISIPYLLNKQEPDYKSYNTFTLRKVPVWIQLSKIASSLDQTGLLIKANEELKSSGEYARIIKKYADYTLD